MMIPDAKSTPLTPRERLLRERRGLQNKLSLLQTKNAAIGDCWEADLLPRGRRGMETAMIHSIQDGLARIDEQLRWLARTKWAPAPEPLLPLDALFDALFLLEFDFFQLLDGNDQTIRTSVEGG